MASPGRQVTCFVAHRTAIPGRKSSAAVCIVSEVHKPSLGPSRVHTPGFCVDTRAPNPVIGLPELRCIYATNMVITPQLRKSTRRFKFSYVIFQSLGLNDLPLATPSGKSPIYITLDILSADIPPVMRLEVMNAHSLTPNTVSNELQECHVFYSHAEESPALVDTLWNIPMTSCDDHVYAAMSPGTSRYFSKTQLQKLHRQICHPSADNLYKLLKISRPENLDSSTLDTLKDLTSRFDPF